MPRSMNFEGNFTHTVTLNGAEVLANIQPELTRMVEGQIKTSLQNVFQKQFPQMGAQI
jgi:hypothetical protein